MSSKNQTELNHLGRRQHAYLLSYLLILLAFSVREYLSRQTGYEHIVEEMDKMIASNEPAKVFTKYFLRHIFYSLIQLFRIRNHQRIQNQT